MPVVRLEVEEGVEEAPRSLEVQLEQDVHAEAEELPLPPPVGRPQLLPHLRGERVPGEAGPAVPVSRNRTMASATMGAVASVRATMYPVDGCTIPAVPPMPTTL